MNTANIAKIANIWLCSSSFVYSSLKSSSTNDVERGTSGICVFHIASTALIVSGIISGCRFTVIIPRLISSTQYISGVTTVRREREWISLITPTIVASVGRPYVIFTVFPIASCGVAKPVLVRKDLLIMIPLACGNVSSSGP